MSARDPGDEPVPGWLVVLFVLVVLAALGATLFALGGL